MVSMCDLLPDYAEPVC